MEKLVRQVPLDRRCTSITEQEGGAVLLEITAAGHDLGRVRKMLEADQDAHGIETGG